jgi:hypothetical protein
MVSKSSKCSSFEGVLNMPYEVFMHKEKYDEKAEVWALGVLMLSLATMKV